MKGMAAAPLPLAYDDLPPGSDIRRERAPGMVRIVVPAGEPSRAAMQQTLRDALAWGSIASILLLLIASYAFRISIAVQRISGGQLLWAWAFFALFCAALVALVSWVRYGVMADALRAGRRQSTIIAATPTRLMIETTGPFGDASHDLPADQIRRIQIDRSRPLDDLGQRRSVRHLTLRLSDARTIRLLPARDRAELACVAAMIGQALDIAHADSEAEDESPNPPPPGP
jgi:hypothetical protein